MSWRVGLLAAVTVWLLWAGPAAAQIQRHTDSQGVIHIGNVAPRLPQPSLTSTPAAIPAAEADVQEPLSPSVPPSRPETEKDASPAANLEAINKVGEALGRSERPAQSHEFDGIVAAAALAAATRQAAEVAAEPEPLPLRLVSHDQDRHPAAKAATAPNATVTASGIRRYRDAQGVWHISNAPAAEDLGAAVQMAAGPDHSGNLPQETEAAEPRLPIRQAAWSPDEERLASLPAAPAPARKTAPGPGAIRHYRDSQGVIHISNVEPEPGEARPATGLMAQARSKEDSASSGIRPAPTLAMGGWTLQPVAWDGAGGIKLLKRGQAAAPQNDEITTEGGIRRHRDKTGVIHIKTVEYSLPPGVVLPPRRAAIPPNASLAAAPPASAGPGPPLLANIPGPAASGLSPNSRASGAGGAQITAFKDAKGRLHVTTTAPQPEAAKIFPPMALKPELEPLIQEAAQIHRLPPSLIRAVIKVESDFCSWAVSPKGAMGLMQLMPGTANLLGVREPFNPRDNILGGCRYLRDLINLCGGNLPLALASYNAGYQRVIDCGYQIPAIKETQDFVTQVLGRYVAEEKRGPQPWT
jgi:soluble lytic murein transglycosylase-like protein